MADFLSAPGMDRLLDVCMAILGVLMLCCLIRAVLGPRTADRVIAINMISTLVVILICILTLRLDQDYLTDVAMIYTMLSFLAVVLLTRIYTGVWRQRHRKGGKPHA